MIELKFPMPAYDEDTHVAQQHLSDAGDRLEKWLRAEFDGQFEISSSPLSLDFGGYWEKQILAHKDGNLHATFSLEWNSEIYANEFTVACNRVPLPDPTAPARFASSAFVGVASAIFLTPLSGVIAGLATYMVLKKIGSIKMPSTTSFGLNEDTLLRTGAVLQPS